MNSAPVVFQFPPDYSYWPTYDWPVPVDLDLFFVQLPVFTALVVATPTTNTVTIPNEADFECRYILYEADLAGVAQLESTRIIPNVNMQFQESGSRIFMNAPVPLTSVACYGSNPRPLPWPHLFARSSQISVTLTSFEAAATPTIRLTLAGRKIFTDTRRL